MTGNLIGEPFFPFVFNQIEQRQILQGKGYKGNRSDLDIQMLNSSTSFLKLASGVDIFQPSPEVTQEEFVAGEGVTIGDETITPVDETLVGPLTEEQSSASNGYVGVSTGDNDVNVVVKNNEAVKANKEKLKTINEQIKANNKLQAKSAKNKLKRLGFTNTEIKRFKNTNTLAKNAVLFNGLSSLSGGKLNQRFGISGGGKSVWDETSAYGLGGSKFGRQPMPGIISAEIKCVNRGSIRSATVEIKAFNQFQFELLELLYMRLGFTMLLEWGHSIYVDNNGKKQNMGTTLVEGNHSKRAPSFFQNQVRDQREVLDSINFLRAKYNGNYDGFFGRVTNFSWSFSPDGTYDITLELYTLGDVVESLTVNVPADKVGTTYNEDGTSNVTPTGYTVLDKWLDSYIATYGNNAVTGNGRYINLCSINYNGGSYVIKKEFITGWGGEGKQLTKNFCTVKELLEKIVEYTIPLVVGKTTYPLVDFNLDESTNIVSAQPNQISYDLGTCFIKPSFLGLIQDDVGRPATFSKSYIKDYFVLETENGADLYYGQFMNIYLNFKFIKQQLKKNINDKGELTLYKFLVGICDGINSALGDVNQIQPIIKNGNQIVFIDQVQPKGNNSILNKLIPAIPKVKKVPFELFGYNTSGKVKKSNFVYNFSFESKIDSSLATSLAIGSTAGKSNTALTDGTAFSTWNAGLQDRFTPQIISPKVDIDTTQLQEEEEKIDDAELEKYWKGDYDSDEGKDTETDWNVDGEFFGFEETRDVRIGNYTGNDLTLGDFKRDYRQWLNSNKNIQTKTQFESSFKGTGYKELLAYAFGGIAGGGQPVFLESEAKYLDFENKNFYTSLKQAFRSYIQKRDEKIFKVTNTSSQREGFIPLSLTIDMLGLSGIKIYNKLPVVTRFLPSQFTQGNSTSLDFIIESVDHKISDNNWETSISTLSIPPSQPTEVRVIDEGLFAFLNINVTLPSVTNVAAYSVYVVKQPWSACFISYLSRSNGIQFRYSSAHRKFMTYYKQNSTKADLEVKPAGDGFVAFDPREGTTYQYGDKKTINSDLNKRTIYSYSKFNVDTVYNDGTSGFSDFKGIQVGDIIVYNRKNKDGVMNDNYYSEVSFQDSTKEYKGSTHSDIVVEINGEDVYTIGGNVGNKVSRVLRYKLSTKPITISVGSQFSTTYKTNGAIRADYGFGKHVFGAIRPPADKISQLIATAQAQYQIWKSNGWKESDPPSYPYTAAYYKAGGMRAPTEGGESSEANV